MSSPLRHDTDDVYSNAGYCFVEFPSGEAANKALSLTGTPIPGSNGKHFKLNWASGGGLVDRRYVHALGRVVYSCCHFS